MFFVRFMCNARVVFNVLSPLYLCGTYISDGAPGGV